jgi:predicted PurR-regulated permease PerM
MDFLNSKQQRAGLIIVLLGIGILIAIAPFDSGLLGASVLYVMCVPVYRRLKGIVNADLAAAITLVGAILCIALPIAWIIFLAADQLPDALRGAQKSDVIQRLSTIRVGRLQVGTEIAKASGPHQWLSSQAIGVVSRAARATLSGHLVLRALLHAALRGYRSACSGACCRSPGHRGRAARASDARDAARHDADGGAAGTLIGVGFRLVGIPNAALWGVVTGSARSFRCWGALVWLPGTLVLVIEQRYGWQGSCS